MINFPKLDEKNLNVVSQLYAENPKLFERADCPYRQETIDLFTAGDKNKTFEVTEEDLESLNDDDQIFNEIASLWAQLKKQGQTMSESDTASERNTYFRLSVTLLEKVVSIRERMMNIKKMHDFTSHVLSILEEEMEKDQRTRVINKLKARLEEK